MPPTAMQAAPTPDPRSGQPGSREPEPGERNALGAEPSAYLRQHAGNPVHWQPFGDAAFAGAASRDVPVFLSIGYAACHWCHVMARESFEDQATADYLNGHFVAVKVDREERPDVDAVYMAATQAISGEGGWPMSVFLTPEGRAFHAGTYFPPRPMPGRPSFRQVLEAVHEAWTERRGAVEENARSLAQNMGQVQLAAAVDVSRPPEPLDAGLLPAAVRSLAGSEDPDDGGFGTAPKFPPSAVLEFLVRHAAVPSDTAEEAREMAGRTLAAMARSALFDQLDGGFARYSVTRDWSVPHFEKMLYDNAQLLRVYVHWIRLGGTAGFPAAEAADVAARTADWMLTALGLPEGGLASSLDADTVVDGEHHEGASYLWTPGELERVLGAEDAAAVAWMMNVGARGTVSELGSPLHPGRALDGDEAQLWSQVRPRPPGDPVAPAAARAGRESGGGLERTGGGCARGGRGSPGPAGPHGGSRPDRRISGTGPLAAGRSAAGVGGAGPRLACRRGPWDRRPARGLCVLRGRLPCLVLGHGLAALVHAGRGVIQAACTRFVDGRAPRRLGRGIGAGGQRPGREAGPGPL